VTDIKVEAQFPVGRVDGIVSYTEFVALVAQFTAIKVPNAGVTG
jgi:hypothetical protein